MRQVTCTAGPIDISAGASYHRTIVEGDVVDLDQVLVPASASRPAVTLEAALGHHVADAFEPVTEAVAQMPDAFPVAVDSQE